MDTDDLDLIVESHYDDNPPADWKEGFTEDSAYKLKTDEVPFKVNGDWFLYVYSRDDGREMVYSFADDRGYEYDEFHDYLEKVKTPTTKVNKY